MAHDLNNLLSVILFNAGFIAEDPAADTVRFDAERIQAAAELAVGLTRQLFTMADPEAAEPPEPPDLPDLP